MDMKLDEVAKLLDVQQESIEKWIEEENLPAYQINKEYRFDRDQVERWMIEHLDKLSPSSVHPYSLYRALHRGGLSHMAGKTKEEVLKLSLEELAANHPIDASVVTDLLLDREQLMPTTINRGIAIPHTREFLLGETFDLVSLVYLQEPIEYGALDGKPVHTLFLLFACNDRRHLDLLRKIAHFCSIEENLALLNQRTGKAALLKQIQQWEQQLIF